MTKNGKSASLSDLFSSYHPMNGNAISDLWKHSHFVLDANVLLNFYRYSSSTKDEFIHIIDKLKHRIWIPHHAALEFEKNRLTVIADQKLMFSKVKKAVQSGISSIEKSLDDLQLERRHSTIEPSTFLKSLKKEVAIFVEQLIKLESEQVDVFQNDTVYENINSLFAGRIGPPYTNQARIKEISAEREKRSKSNRPPGFRDRAKEDADGNEYHYCNLSYLRVDGDMILWNQIIDFAKDDTVKGIIFITDDRKDDWWYIIESDGKKTMGPRPELIEEISQLTNGTKFWMYRPDRFVSYARQFLSVNVAESTVDEIRDLAASEITSHPSLPNYRKIREAIIEWIAMTFSELDFQSTTHDDRSNFDGICINNITGHRVMINIMALQDYHSARRTVSAIQYCIRSLNAHLSESDRGLAVIAVKDIEAAEYIYKLFRPRFSNYFDRIQAWVGVCDELGDGNRLFFQPIIHLNEPNFS